MHELPAPSTLLLHLANGAEMGNLIIMTPWQNSTSQQPTVFLPQRAVCENYDTLIPSAVRSYSQKVLYCSLSVDFLLLQNSVRLVIKFNTH